MNDRFTISRVAAGLQAGMAGALVMLGWLGIATLWSRHSIWWFPNLMGTTFGGDSALKTGFGKYSAAGLALHLTQFSALGALFGSLVPVRTSRIQMLLLGLLTAMAYYFAMYGFVWKYVNPLIPLYSPDRAVLVGHILFGWTLGRLGRYAIANVPVTE